MSIEIRPSTPVDANAIREVHLAAFPTPLEADLVDRLTREGDSVNSLVAEDKAAIVGHVLLSRMRVEGDGRTFRALGLAPVAVLPRTAQGSSRYVIAPYEWRLLDGIGHFPHLESPDLVLGEILRWAKS